MLIERKQLNLIKVFLDCGIQPTVDGTTRYTCSPGFNKVPIFDVFFNSHSDNLNDSIFRLPTSGTYLIYSKIRPLDNTNTLSYGQGVHSSEIDGSWFIWGNTYSGANTNRNGLQNTRISNFTQNTELRLYSYFESSVNISAASLQIYLLEEN